MNFLIIISLFFSLSNQESDVNGFEKVRNAYLMADQSHHDCKKLIDLVKEFDAENNPIIYGYQLSSKLIEIKFIVNPIKKLTLFNELSESLDSLIKQHPTSVEIRLMRYTTQKEAPNFLNYNSEIENDLVFINEKLELESEKTKRYIRLILNNFNNAGTSSISQ